VTLMALMSYYAVRVDLRRIATLLDAMRSNLGQEHHGFHSWVAAWSGAAAYARGDFEAAASHLQAATNSVAVADHEVESVWFIPHDSVAVAHVHLALTHMVRGDRPSSRVELTRAARWIEELGFPEGPYMRGYARFVEVWGLIEAADFASARTVVAELIDHGERHGLDVWRMWGRPSKLASTPFPLWVQRISTLVGCQPTWRP